MAGISAKTSQLRAVRVWLIAVAGLIALMVLVGGATRLTESGLSIVEWKPVTGALPPTSTFRTRVLRDCRRVIMLQGRTCVWSAAMTPI